jgi:S1-C subfamily serine protease
MKRIQNSLISGITAGLLIVAGFTLALLLVPRLTGSVVEAIDSAAPPQIVGSTLLEEQERVYTEIYNTVAPSVVSISISARRSANGLFSPISSGSGFVIDTAGHIVTNYHVVSTTDQADEVLGENGEIRVEVSMFDGTLATAEVVGTDPDSDLAVIRVNISPERLRPVTIGNSDALSVGQLVFAIGNPFSNDWTLTTGIVSALNRSIVGLNSFSIGGVIQTDAAINPGNSGGPLVNMRGEVIGVNSQIESETRSNSGIGFAVPSNLVAKVASNLIARGRIEYSYIGIQSRPIDLNMIEAFNLPNNIRGVAIQQVLPNTPAARAGLQGFGSSTIDILTAINGRPVTDFDEMIGYLAINTNPGDTITVTVYRNGQVLQLPVTLTNRP